MVGSFRAQNFQKSRKFHELQRKWFHVKPREGGREGVYEGLCVSRGGRERRSVKKGGERKRGRDGGSEGRRDEER